jgi:hypothetical protein
VVDRFSWLLVSDIHLKATNDPWSQKVVLRDLVRSVEARLRDGNVPSFVIVSGDLAYSGIAEEYGLVRDFLDALAGALGLPRRLFYLVSGNHDINRKKQTTCFAGARHILSSAQSVDEFLGIADERETLFKRVADYRNFDATYCSGQIRQVTADGLGYVAPIEIEGLPICLLGLHSSWICGGDNDKGNLLVGDRPIIDSIELLRNYSPRLVLGVMHHPCEWMQEFDQRSLESRLLPTCDVLHRGHLHDPGSKLVSMIPGRACIIVAAGAGYGGRLFENSYSYVTAELSRGECRIETFVYSPSTNDFRPQDDVRFPLRLRGALPGTAEELSRLIAQLPDAAQFANYISAIVHGSVSEVPTRIRGQLVFVAQSLIDESEDTAFSTTAKGVFEIANLLLAFRDGVPLADRFLHIRERVVDFASMLKQAAESDEYFARDLSRREDNCRGLIAVRHSTPFGNTEDLMKDLAANGEWGQLESVARQRVGSTSRALAAIARRYLVVALANQGDEVKDDEACALALDIIRSPGSEAADYVRAATLLHNRNQHQQSCDVLKEFAGRYPEQRHLIASIGQKVVIATGDNELVVALGLSVNVRRAE